MLQKTLDGRTFSETEKKSVEHKLEEANAIANDLVERLKKWTEKIEVVGSIRRKKPIVHDIDIVAIAKPHFLNSGVLKLLDVKIIRSGKKIIELEYKGIQVDIYLANGETFETLKLIRTGSEQHNIKLCMLAKKKGWHLYANGNGLYDNDLKKIADTEEGILIALLGKSIPPEEREVEPK